jgi:diguanylate cyclase (GGDEF)-like protein
MLLFKQLLSLKYTPHRLDDEHKRKYHLIQAISLELLLLNVLLLALTIYLHFSFITYLLLSTIFCVCFNLILLKKNTNLLISGHIINILCCVMITAGNLWLGGAATSTLDWFYISPIIATVTIGLAGLVIYSALSGMMLVIFLSADYTPFYFVSASSLNVLAHVNPILIFLLLCTILYNLLTENRIYEALLKEQNFLLFAEKQKFHYLSHHDSLTSLPNRSYFHTRLQELMVLAQAGLSAITLYFMDLDGFKKINDHYGHKTGDILLLQVSKRLQACFRENDFIARLGGDEFTAVITHPLQDTISSVLAERIKVEFSTPFLIKGRQIQCSISIGKASFPLDANNAEAILKLADASMYKHKKKKQRAAVA